MTIWLPSDFRYTPAMRFLLVITLFALTSYGQSQSSPEAQRSAPASHHATGTFDVKIAPLESYNKDDKSLGHYSIDKQFHGALEGTSKGEMLGAGDPSSSAGAVAIEKFTGKLDGRNGSFVLLHSAFMKRGVPQEWNISVVPDSGTGELSGISGKMKIIAEGGKHSYVFDYTLD
jgi:Protein of unknown function (DUF3224)